MECAIGVSSGEVTYGNVGARGRLDFTVTGPTANLAARLSDHGKHQNLPILLDGATAQHVTLPLAECGSFEPRNFDREVTVYAPPDIPANPEQAGPE